MHMDIAIIILACVVIFMAVALGAVWFKLWADLSDAIEAAFTDDRDN